MFKFLSCKDTELNHELQLAYQLIDSLEKEVAELRSGMKPENKKLDEEDYLFLVNENERLAKLMKRISHDVVNQEADSMYRVIRSLANELSKQRDPILSEVKLRQDIKEIINDTFHRLLDIFSDLSSDILLRHRENARDKNKNVSGKIPETNIPD